MRRPIHRPVTNRSVNSRRVASLRQWFRHRRLQLGEWLYWRPPEVRTKRPALPSRSTHGR